MDYNRAFRLDGKVALVTGAARGIGAAIATALAASGAAVLVTDVLESEGRQTVQSIRDAGGRAEFFKHDVTDEAQWEAAVASAVKQLGGLDVLVNNAGIETAAFLTQCSLGDFKRVMDVNVNGVFLGVKHAARAMAPGGAAGKGGAIVNLSSVAGLIGTSGHIAYHTSKGAVRLLTKAAAIECAQLGTGIRVNSVHPAIVQTDMGTNFIRHFVDLSWRRITTLRRARSGPRIRSDVSANPTTSRLRCFIWPRMRHAGSPGSSWYLMAVIRRHEREAETCHAFILALLAAGSLSMPDTCGCAMPSPVLMSQRRRLGGPGRRGLSHSEVATLQLVPVCEAKLGVHPQLGREMTVKQQAVFAFKSLLASKARRVQLLSGSAAGARAQSAGTDSPHAIARVARR